MIKVLEHGVRKVTCPNCRAKLQYEQEDISEEIIPALLGEDEIRQYITCPDCGNKIVLTPIKFHKVMTDKEKQLILRRIEELEKHQNEQDRKLEWLHDRVSPNL